MAFAGRDTFLVVEVKTTDAYRISIDTISTYREKLIGSGRIAGKSSVLIVVGRQDTGELEAQVRGSRHAWDVRLISVEALSKLVLLKENSDEEETGRKIRSVLIPVEYTRLDALVDVMFTTATDVEAQAIDVDLEGASASESMYEPQPGSRSPVFTDSRLLQAKRDQIVATMSKELGAALVKKVAPLIGAPIT